MKADSTIDVLHTCVRKFGRVTDDPAVAAFDAVTGMPPILGASVGTTRANKRTGDYKVAVFATDHRIAAKIVAEAKGEAIVTMVPEVKARATGRYMQKHHARTKLIGEQWEPAHRRHVGTASVPVKLPGGGTGKLTNTHVVEETARPGDTMLQAGSRDGVVWGLSGIDYRVPNAVDSAIIGLRKGKRYSTTDPGLRRRAAGFRRRKPSDVGHEFTKTGRTTGTTFLRCIAVGVHGQPIAYERGIAYVNNLGVYTGRDSVDGSAGGDSGSVIAALRDAYYVDLLFAGGPDSRGQDLTFACDVIDSIMAANGIPEIAA